MEGGEQGSCAARRALNRCAGLQCSSCFLAEVVFSPPETSAICALRARERGVSVPTLTMVAKCLRCHKMYEEEGGGGCYYHPGTHRGDSHYGRTGLMCGWSCCKVLPPARIP